MRVLVTGGAGFIGSHLVDALLARREEVTVVDDLSTGRRENLAAAERSADSGRLKFIEGDASDEELLRAAAKGAEFVFHLAAAVGVRRVVDEPVRSLDANVEITRTVLRVCAERRTPLLLTSTSEVYGRSEAAEYRETADCRIGPPRFRRWSYACSKLLDEFYALAYRAERGLPVIVVRLFNTVGPRQRGRWGMVVPRFVKAALRGEPLAVHGTGEQKRCFTAVRDTVRALLLLRECPRAVGEVVNIGGREEIAIMNLAKKVVALTGSTSKIRTISYAEAYGEDFEDMTSRRPDASLLKELTGFAPNRPLDEILAEVIAAAREEEKIRKGTA